MFKNNTTRDQEKWFYHFNRTDDKVILNIPVLCSCEKTKCNKRGRPCFKEFMRYCWEASHNVKGLWPRQSREAGLKSALKWCWSIPDHRDLPPRGSNSGSVFLRPQVPTQQAPYYQTFAESLPCQCPSSLGHRWFAHPGNPLEPHYGGISLPPRSCQTQATQKWSLPSFWKVFKILYGTSIISLLLRMFFGSPQFF